MLKTMRGDALAAEPASEADRLNTLVYCDRCERLIGHFGKEGGPIAFQGEYMLPPIEFRDHAGKVRRSFHFCSPCGSNNGDAFTEAIVAELVALYDERERSRAKLVEIGEALAKVKDQITDLKTQAGLLESAAVGSKFREHAFIGIIQSARELFDLIFKRPGSPQEARELSEAITRWKALAEKELKNSPIAGMMMAAALVGGARKERGDG